MPLKMSPQDLQAEVEYIPIPNQPLEACTRNLRLAGGSVLHADCLLDAGSDIYREANFDLNVVLGNQNGHFHFGSNNFVASARNVRLEGTRLVGELRACNGQWQTDSLDLDLYVCNKWGSLSSPRRPADGSSLWERLDNVHLEESHILRADCRSLEDDAEGKIPTSIDLNAIIGNMNGHFHFGTSGYLLSARNVRLEGSKLVGELRNVGWWSTWRLDNIDLDTCLSLADGRLAVRR